MQIDERPLVKTNNDQMNENRSLIPLGAKVPSLKISFLLCKLLAIVNSNSANLHVTKRMS